MMNVVCKLINLNFFYKRWVVGRERGTERKTTTFNVSTAATAEMLKMKYWSRLNSFLKLLVIFERMD